MTRQLTRHPCALSARSLALLAAAGSLTPGPAESRWQPPPEPTARQIAAETRRQQAITARICAANRRPRSSKIPPAVMREGYQRIQAGECSYTVERSLGLTRNSLNYHLKSRTGGFSAAMKAALAQ